MKQGHTLQALLIAATIAAIGLTASQEASAQTPPATATPAASASPTPAPTPFASGTIGGVLYLYGIQSYAPNATGALDTATGADRQGRDDTSDMLVNAAYTSGLFKASITGGGYSFPTIGQAINPTFQSCTGSACVNTNAYSAVPLASIAYTSKDQHLTVIAGKLGTMLGAEGIFTYQNVNVQRGLAWALEPVISRGVHVGYANGPWSVALEDSDGYYSGSHRAIEYSFGWAPSSTTSLTFVGINPGGNTPGNPTAGIANKSEYNLMYAHTAGKWQFSPYVLWVTSPSSAALGYATSESAWAASLLGSYTFSSQYSLGFRIENVSNRSSTSDAGLNADLIGYGPGSGATTFTLTPTYKFATYGMARIEFSHVGLRNALPGIAFGPAGTATTQNRIGIELGVMR